MLCRYSGPNKITKAPILHCKATLRIFPDQTLVDAFSLHPIDRSSGDLAEGLGGEPGCEDAGGPVAAALVTDPARGAVQTWVVAADVLLPTN